MKLEDKIIITIDREFGSGGREVARRLSERLSIPLFDDELISMAADNTGYDKDYIKENDERAPMYPISSVFSTINTYQFYPGDSIQSEEFKIIKEAAAKGSCIILGHAADYILNDERHISIFIFAPLNERIKRTLKIAELDKKYDSTTKKCDLSSIEKLIKQTDRERRRYYEFYTDNRWGDRDVYDLLINTSRAGVDGAVDIIEAYITGGKGKDLLSDLRVTDK